MNVVTLTSIRRCGLDRTKALAWSLTRASAQGSAWRRMSCYPSRTTWRNRKSRRQPLGYRRFAQAADAIRFAIEELPRELLLGAYLEVDEERYGSEEIHRLYESTDYPLARRAAA